MNKLGQKNRHLLPLCVWLAAVLLLEIFCFNAASFHLIGGNYKRGELSLSDATVEGATLSADGTLQVGEDTVTLEWRGLNRRLGTLRLVGEWQGEGCTTLLISAADDTNAAYRAGVATATVLSSDTRSHTAVLRMSGKVHDLRLTLSASAGSTLTLSQVAVNRPVFFRLSAVRVGWLWLIGLLVWLYFTGETLRLPCSANKKRTDLAFFGVTTVFLLVAVGLTAVYMASHTEGVLREFTLTDGDQITKELVDAFEKGQVHLIEQPSHELLQMENPYDWSAREAQGVSYLWDHCLYDGKYYSYYGIAPVLLLFLPYHLLTGYYFSAVFAVLLFGGVGIAFLTLTYRVFIRKFFPDLPLRLALFGLVTLHLSSGIWYCFCAMNFYEIAQSAGFCFVTMGAYFLLSANVVGGGRISPARIALATACLSLAVLSRPTTAVYCIVALVFLGFGLKKRAKTRDCGLAGYLLTALLPFVLFGGLQMVYNYLRFDSFLDFGIQYSLTINDFTRAEFHPRFVTVGVYNYLFAPPALSLDFPFVHPSFDTLQPNGYYFVANTYAVGLVWRAVPVLGLLCAGKALKKLPKPHRLPAVALIGSLSVVAPAVILFSIWESGYGVRYAVDFSWQMVMGGLAVLFFLYQTGKNNGVRRLCDRAAVWSLPLTFLANFATVYAFVKDEITSAAIRQGMLYFESIFSFWK